MMKTDARNDDLMEHFRQGDVVALKHVVERYQREIHYFSAGILKDREAAEEIVGDCFLKIWQIRTQFSSLGELKSYLYVMARNACLNFLKSPRNKRWQSLEDQPNPSILADDDIEARIIYSELLSAVHAEVEKLSEKQRQVFRLSYFEGLSPQEIAMRLGITANAVYVYKHEATQLIRKAFKGKDMLFYLFFLQFTGLVN